MIDNNITKSIANAYVKMYEAKAVKREAWVPAEITDEGVADFMGAAADAAKKGDETFKFGDKTYKVTMKKATADKINEAKKLRPTDKVSIVGRGPGQLDISAHIRKLFKLKDMDVYFDDADLVIKDKTAVQGALRNNSMTIADLEDAVRKSGLVKEEVEESLQEAKTLKPNDKVSVVGRGMGQTDVSAHIRKTFKLKDMDAYFDGVDLVVKNKTAVKGALKDPSMTIADLEDAVRKSGLVKEVAEPEAQGEKDFKDMHTNNTKKSGEKDDGTVVKENTKLQEAAVKVNPVPFKGKGEQAAADSVLTKAGFIFGKTPDMLSFEEPGHIDPKTGNKVVIMQRGKQFAVSSADGSTIQRPSPMDRMVGWLRSNRYKV